MNLEQRLRTADREAVARALPGGAALVEFVRSHTFDFKAVPAKGQQQSVRNSILGGSQGRVWKGSTSLTSWGYNPGCKTVPWRPGSRPRARRASCTWPPTASSCVKSMRSLGGV
jgi:hypothetical protein